jgi:hypothetical protein
MIDVLNLLQAEGALSSDPEIDRFLHKRNEVRGMYAVAALCLASPILSLDKDPPSGALTPADFTYADVEVIYWGFFRGWRAPLVESTADPADVDGTAKPPRNRGGLRDATE